MALGLKCFDLSLRTYIDANTRLKLRDSKSKRWNSLFHIMHLLYNLVRIQFASFGAFYPAWTYSLLFNSQEFSKAVGKTEKRASTYNSLWVNLCDVAVFPSINIFCHEIEEI